MKHYPQDDINAREEFKLPVSQAANHSFNPIFAAHYGVNEAILIAHFQYWINHNQTQDKNFRDGRTWTYQTRKEMAAWFPYFSEDQVRRLTDTLVKRGVLVKGNYNRSKIDKTIWYAFENEEIFTTGEIAKWIGENARRTGGNATPIPDAKTHPKPDTKRTPSPTPSSKPDSGKARVFKDGEEKERVRKPDKPGPDPKKSPPPLNVPDAVKQHNLTESQADCLTWLVTLKLRSNISTLVRWVETQHRANLKALYEDAKLNAKKSIGAYMAWHIQNKKEKGNEHSEENRETARLFQRSVGKGLVIIRHSHATIKLDCGYEEQFPYVMPSLAFLEAFENKFGDLHANAH